MTLVDRLVDRVVPKELRIDRIAVRGGGLDGDWSAVRWLDPDADVGESARHGAAPAISVPGVLEATTFLADEIGGLDLRFAPEDSPASSVERPEEFRALWQPLTNPAQTRSTWLGSATLSIALWGAAYCPLGWTRLGELGDVRTVSPEAVQPRIVDEGTLAINVAGHGSLVNRPGQRPEFMFVPWHMWPGYLTPLSPVGIRRQSLAVSGAVQRTAANVLGRGLQVSGIVLAKSVVEDDQARQTSDRLSAYFGGPSASSSGKFVVIGADGGMDYKPITMPLEDAQFLEQRAYGLDETLAIWRVPPFAVGRASSSGAVWGAGIAEMNRGVERFTLRPYVLRITQALNAYVLAGSGLVARAPFQPLAAAPAAERFSAYRTGLAAGFLTRERVLEIEGMEPPDAGEEFYTPLNYASDEARAVALIERQAKAAQALIAAGWPRDAAYEEVGLPVPEEGEPPPAPAPPPDPEASAA